MRFLEILLALIVSAWDRVKVWFVRQYQKVRKWVIGLLVAIGLVAAPLIYAEIVTFTYTAATERIDGTAMPINEIKETRLYCDGAIVETKPGADGTFAPSLGIGTHNCYATHVDTLDQESAPSNTVTKVVTPALPGAPVLDP